jgi:hypothetical protein
MVFVRFVSFTRLFSGLSKWVVPKNPAGFFWVVVGSPNPGPYKVAGLSVDMHR